MNPSPAAPEPDAPDATKEEASAPRVGLSAPLWIGILTVAILALLAFLGRASFAA